MFYVFADLVLTSVEAGGESVCFVSVLSLMTVVGAGCGIGVVVLVTDTDSSD